MTHDVAWSWVALLLLGATHGINPGMGWLFAVALGLQERSRRAVWRALGPLAAGHALAIAATLAVAAAIGAVLPLRQLRWLVAASLLVVAWRTFSGHRHPRWGGMRVGARDLTIWSFLMATAHGAGLMVLPFVLGDGSAGGAGAVAHQHVAHAAVASGLPAAGAGAALVHAAGYLLVTGLVAVVVYERVGLRMLRSAWINLDVIWAAALVATAVLTIML
jgi:hypothetical protein